MDIAEFKKCPVLGIIRGITFDKIDLLVTTIIESGLKAIEITMNTPEALELIRRAHKMAQGRLAIGAGTVLTKDEMQQALDVGASFIVSPTLIPEIVSDCARHSIPVFPGALSPQEIYAAWQAGATMVKVFPAKMMGPEYIKEVKGPFADIELLACGGITPANVKTYFTCGASAVAFGGSVFRREWLLKGQYPLIAEKIKEFLNALRSTNSDGEKT